MRLIPLSRGMFAVIDAEDYERVSKFNWCYQSGGYAYRKYVKGEPSLMHRFIMNAPDGVQVDHRFGNRLDNRKEAMRLCVELQNGKNMKLKVNNTTGYKGVSIAVDRRRGRNIRRIRAYISVNYKKIHLPGNYSTLEEAAIAYNNAALKYHGEFARLNKIKENNEIK